MYNTVVIALELKVFSLKAKHYLSAEETATH